MRAGGCRRPGSRGCRAAASLALPFRAVLALFCFLPLTPGCIRAIEYHPNPPFPGPLFRSLSRCSGIRTSAHGLSRRRPKERVSVCAPVFCVRCSMQSGSSPKTSLGFLLSVSFRPRQFVAMHFTVKNDRCVQTAEDRSAVYLAVDLR